MEYKYLPPYIDGMKAWLPLIIMALFCGCIGCGDISSDLGGDSFDFSKILGSTEAEEFCKKPYMEYEGDCCLDYDENGVCDNLEYNPKETTTTSISSTTVELQSTTIKPSTSTTTKLTSSTTSTTTTTTLPGEPETMELSFGWKEYKNTGYKFRFDGKTGVSHNMKYTIIVQTKDGYETLFPVSTQEAYIDYLRFKVLNYGESTPRILVRVNVEDLSEIPATASLITIGGQSCTSDGKGICERKYGPYTIRMMNRITDGAHILIQAPPDKRYLVNVYEGRKTHSEDRQLIVGGFFDRKHIMTGGYSLFYLQII